MSRSRIGPAPLVVLAGSVLVGCGSDDTCLCPCPQLGTGGAIGTGGAVGEGGTGGTENPYQLTADKWGSVRFLSFEHAGNMFMQASFYDTPQVLHPSCQIHSNEICDVRLCPITETVDPEVKPDAGPIYVRSGQVEGQASITPDETGTYSGSEVRFNSTIFFYFEGGEPLTFEAVGAEVPGFAVESTYPQAVNVVDPPGEGGVITADATVGLTLTLSGGAEGDELYVFGRVTDEAAALETTMVCTFPSMIGTVTLPPELLGLLPDGFSLTAYRMRREVVAAGEYEVTVRLLGELDDATDTNAVSIVVRTAR